MTTIQAVDWAIRKPLCIYDGKNVKKSHDPRDITADVVLMERGAPYSLIAQIGNKKILMVSGEETSKFRGGIKKSDAEDAIAIWKLYQQNPELFKQIDQRNVYENKLRYHIKMRYSTMQAKFKLNNESQALNREYIASNVYKDMIEYLGKIQETHEKELLRWAKYLYVYEVGTLTQMKGVGELNASIFVTLVDMRKFTNLSKLMMYCGFGHTYDKQTHPTNHRYNRIIKNVIGTTCRSIKMHKIEPYYGIYSRYKQKKLDEGKPKGHAENLAMRKVSQKLIKEFRRRMLNVARDRIWINEHRPTVPNVNINIDVNSDDNVSINIKVGKKGKIYDKSQRNIEDAWN